MTGSFVRIVLIFAACSVGAVAHVSIRGLPWMPDLQKIEARDDRKKEVNEEHEKMRATMGVTLEEFQSLIAQGAIVIDARPASEFEKSHMLIDAVPPVLNVEPQNADANLGRLTQLLGQQFVFYCTSETCELAEELFVALRPHGFTEVKIFFPGWEAIQKAGWPTTSGPDTWTGFDAPPTEPTAEAPEEE